LRKSVIIAVILGLLATGVFFAKTRQKLPGTLGLDVSTDLTTVALMHAKVNGVVWVDGSLRGRNQSGRVRYDQGDRLEFELVWRDVLKGKVWRSVVSLKPSELPTFGDKGEHTSVDIILGPGPDVTVTTSSALVMKLIGDRDPEGLAAAPKEKITLIEACAAPASKDDPVVRTYLNYDASGPEFDRQVKWRNEELAQGKPEKGRCESNT